MKHFNIQKPPKPKMPYGYYTPLRGLENELSKSSQRIAVQESAKKMNLETLPVKVTAIPTQEFQGQRPQENLLLPKNTSYFSKSSMMLLSIAATTTISAAIFLTDPSNETTNQITKSLKNIGQVILSNLESNLPPYIVNYFTPEKIAPFPSEEILTPFNLTDQHKRTIELREKYLSSFLTSKLAALFFANTADKVASAFGKTLTLSGSEGEAPKQFCYLNLPVTDGWCGPGALTREDLETRFNLTGLEEVSNSINLGTDKEKLKENFEKYQYMRDQIPNELITNWFKELKSWPACVQGFQHKTSPNNENFKAWERNEYDFAVQPHEQRSQMFYIFDKSKGPFTLRRAVRSGHHSLGPRKSRWNKFILSCTKPDNKIVCETFANENLDHAAGKLSYKGVEEIKNANCSIIEEILTIGNKEIKKRYALNPNEQLPYFLSKFAISSEFYKYKNLTEKSLRYLDWYCKNKDIVCAHRELRSFIDAKVVIPTSFPALPKTCQELDPQQ